MSSDDVFSSLFPKGWGKLRGLGRWGGHFLSLWNTKTSLGIGLESFPISRLVLVLVLTGIKNQDTSWYWSKKNIHFKTCLGIGLEWKLKSRQVLILVLNKISGLAEHWCKYAFIMSVLGNLLSFWPFWMKFGLFQCKYAIWYARPGGQPPSKCSQIQKCLNLIWGGGVGIFQKVLKFKKFWIIRGGGSSLIGNFSQIFPFFFSDGSP